MKLVFISVLLILLFVTPSKCETHSVDLLIDDKQMPSTGGITEEEHDYILKQLSQNHNMTMMTIVKQEFLSNFKRWKANPMKFLRRLPYNIVKWIKDVVVFMIKDLYHAGKWVIHGFSDIKSALGDVKEFFIEIGSALKELAKMVYADPIRGLSNFLGGLLYFISHHSEEFSAQLILTLAAGFSIITPIADLVESSVVYISSTAIADGTISNLVTKLFIVLHCIDDPLLMMPSILPALTITISSNIESDNTLETKEMIKSAVFDLPANSTNRLTDREFTIAYNSFVRFICLNNDGVMSVPQELQKMKNVTLPEIIDFSKECKEI